MWILYTLSQHFMITRSLCDSFVFCFKYEMNSDHDEDAYHQEMESADEIWNEFINDNLTGHECVSKPKSVIEAALLIFVQTKPHNNPFASDGRGRTPMVYACRGRYESVISFLVDIGIRRLEWAEWNEFFNGPRNVSQPSSPAESSQYQSLSPQPPHGDPGITTPPGRV
jgi:hypothetical protein